MGKLEITIDIKKFLRILLYSTTGIVLLVVGMYTLLHLRHVQTSLVNLMTQYIEFKTGVKIQMKGVDIRPMRSLVLDDVLVLDFKQDTLLYCEKLSMKVDSFSISKRIFTIDEICLDRAVFHLWCQDSTNNTNIEILLDSLFPAPTHQEVPDSLASSSAWWMSLHKITLRNSRFTYREEKFVPVVYEINWTDVDCRDLNVEVTDLDFGSPMQMTVSGLSLVEKSGFRIKNMGGRVKAGAEHLLVTDCYIELDRSQVDLKKMEYHWRANQHDWRYFTSRMKQYYELGPSAVSFIDLAYFNEVLRGITNTVNVCGVVSNTIRKLEGDQLFFEFGNGSVCQGRFKSFGLPDVWNTVFHIDLQDAHFRPEDLATVYLPWFEMYTPVPKPFYNLSYLDFDQIHFEGTLSDFLLQTKSITPALAGDFNFRYMPAADGNPEKVDLKGDFNFKQVDVGRLADFSFLGKGTLCGNYSGVWDEQGPVVQVKSKLSDFNINQAVVQEIDLDLLYENEQLNLLSTFNDDFLKGGCALNCDINETYGFFSAKGQIHLADMNVFGLGLKKGVETLDFQFDFVHANQAKRSFSNYTLTDLQYANDNGSFFIDNISLEDNCHKNYNTTTLKSDILDVVVDGNFRNLRPITFMSELIQSYLPAYSVNGRNSIKKIRKDLSQFDFEFAIDIKDANRVLNVLYPGLSISSDSQITSFFRPDDNQLNLMLSADTIRYYDLMLLNSNMLIAGDVDKLNMNYSVDKISYGGHFRLFNLKNELSLTSNLWNHRINWSNWETKTYSGGLETSVHFRPSSKNDYIADVQIHPGIIVMDDSIWRVAPARLTLQGKELEVKDFSIYKGDERLAIQGKISEDPREGLAIRLKNFDLQYLTRIALENPIDLFGNITGSLVLKDYYKDFLWLSDLQIQDLGIYQDTLGALNFLSYWDTEGQRLLMKMENQRGTEIPFSLSGYYMPKVDSIHVDAQLDKIGLGQLNDYVSDVFSEIRGDLTGNLAIRGLAMNPDISGYVYLDSLAMKVNMLNANYFIDDCVRIEQNRLLFQDFVVKDRNGQEALFNGEYRIWDNRYKFQTEFKRFLVLDTQPFDNDKFYGKMLLSGMADLNNLDDVLNVTVNAQTEAASQLYLPLTAGMTETSNHFLHFITSDASDSKEIEIKNVYSDINLNANLELNDHLNIQVIFDPTVGDILRTTGNGNIKIAFDKDGNLSMFGEYQIVKGDYLFTLSNLVNKKFVLTPGGTINWSGSPYDAVLDINAVYHLKTSITELLPLESISPDEESVTETGRKVPVECILNLSEHLTNPMVKFDINFPTLETQSRSYIQSLFSSQDEINKQMFSLLVLNRFYRTNDGDNYGNQAQTAGVTTLTEMFSNQLSRWLSKYSDNVDIGLAYRFGDRENEMTSDELEVAISTQLLNDRVTISANGNMDVGGNQQTVTNGKTNIAGDFDVEVKLNKQGSLKMKAYSHTDEKLLYNNTETIQGVGVSYQESFDTFRELLRKYFGFLRRKGVK